MEAVLEARRTRSTSVVETEAQALRSALERIVFLECRADELEATLQGLTTERDRARAAASQAEDRESDLARGMAALQARLAAQRAEAAELARRLGESEAGRAEAEARVAVAGEGLELELFEARAELAAERRKAESRERDRDDAETRAGALEHGREMLFQRLIAWQELLPDGPGNLDLAAFIAELRAEIVALEHERDGALSRERELRGTLEGKAPAKVVAPAAPVAPPRSVPPTPTPTALSAAAELDAKGRLRISSTDALAALESLPNAAERRMAAALAAEIGRGSPSARARAAARLVALAGTRAAPALAAAAGACQDSHGRAALVLELGRSGETRALPLARRFFEDGAPEVRAAAVEAAARLSSGEARSRVLSKGAADPDPRVRRSTLLAATALRGLDPGPVAAPLLADPDAQVRRLACAALRSTRDPARATAVVERLADPDASVRAAAAVAVRMLLGEDVSAIAELPPLRRGREIARLRRQVGRGQVERVVREAESERPPDREAVMAVMRSALRGAVAEDVSGELGCSVDAAAATLELLVREGRLNRRGRRLHLA